MAAPDKPLRVLLAAPAYWPATAFGGPIPVMRELASGLARAGWTVDVVTTSLTTPQGPRSWRTRVEVVEGSTITHAATPINYRWMGITPSLPIVLEQRPRPDVVHVFGFRDPVGTTVAAWCRVRRIPYVFEALGMFGPKLRKVGLKRALDATTFRHVPAGASLVLACSHIESAEYRDGGIGMERIALRPNGFPELSAAAPGSLRARLDIPATAPLVLSVGRLASGKGLDLLVRAVARSPDSHLAIVGPDDGHGTSAQLRRMVAELGISDRVHLVGSLPHADVLETYTDADVVALASAHENFGMVAAEAASAGKAILISDRCGIAELLGHDGALIVPFDGEAVRAGLEGLLNDPARRARLGRRASEVAVAWSWPKVVELQQALYERVVSGAATATEDH